MAVSTKPQTKGAPISLRARKKDDPLKTGDASFKTLKVITEVNCSCPAYEELLVGLGFNKKQKV